MADLKISQLASATLPLAGTEVLPIVQSSSTKKVATDDLTVKNVRSNANTGVMQITGPAAGTTRVMTVPDANFTAARTDAGQTFTGDQVISGSMTATSLRSFFGDTAYPTGGVATTIFTMPADGLYFVHFFLNGAGDTSFNSSAQVFKNGASTRLANAQNGANLTISLAGDNIQATHPVAGYPVSYAIQRIA